jgi:hypothetical protein
LSTGQVTVVRKNLLSYDAFRSQQKRIEHLLRRENRMARVATTVVSSIAAPRNPFYTWLVPGVFYDQLQTVLRDAAFLPGVVSTSDTTGPWNVPGSTRIVHLTDGNTVRETVMAATAPDYFAYVITEFSNRMIRGIVKEARGQWWFTDEGSGTKAKWTYIAESKSVFGLLILVPVIKILWHRYMTAGLKLIKQRAEKEVKGSVR